MFRSGDIVVIKTTGEEACVTAGTFTPTQVNGNTINTEAVYTLRIPRITRDGIIHYQENFYGFELETKLDSLRRDLENMKARAALVKEYQQLTEPTVAPATRAN